MELKLLRKLLTSKATSFYLMLVSLVALKINIWWSSVSEGIIKLLFKITVDK